MDLQLTTGSGTDCNNRKKGQQPAADATLAPKHRKGAHPFAFKIAAALSAIITVGAWVLPDTNVGMMEQSTTLKP